VCRGGKDREGAGLKTPAAILEKFEQEASALDYGSVSLVFHKKAGSARFVLQKEESFLVPAHTECAGFAVPSIEQTGKPDKTAPELGKGN